MRLGTAKAPAIRVAVIESDPLRTIGFHAMLDSQREFELTSHASWEAIQGNANIDVALLGNLYGHNLFDVMADLRERKPELPILVVGSEINDEAILKAIASGARGYVDEAAPSAELANAIRVVSAGITWAPRRVLSMFVDRASASFRRASPVSLQDFTTRERQVLEMLVAGKSNKEIALPLGIEERTVKAHVAKLIRKVGAHNRVTLSVHAITQSLVSAK